MQSRWKCATRSYFSQFLTQRCGYSLLKRTVSIRYCFWGHKTFLYLWIRKKLKSYAQDVCFNYWNLCYLLNIFTKWMQNYDWLNSSYRVPTSSGNHGKPEKSWKKVPCIEKHGILWNNLMKLPEVRKLPVRHTKLVSDSYFSGYWWFQVLIISKCMYSLQSCLF